MKKLAVLMAIALVALGVGAIRMWRQIDADHVQISDLQARLQEAQAAQQSSAAELARQAQALAMKSEAPASPAAPATRAAAPAVTAAVQDFLKQMNSPEGRDVRRGQRRMFLTQQYPGLGKWLNLSPDEESRLLDMIARQESDRSEAVLDPANRNNPAAQQETVRNMLAQQQTNDAELAALLGSKYPQFQDYKQTATVHRQVGQLQAMLGSSADGLPEAQATSLTKALVAEQLRINQERSTVQPAAQPPSFEEFRQQQQQRTAENNRRLLQVAATQLNSQQLEGFRKLTEQQERTSNALSLTLGNPAAAAPAASR